MARFAVAQSGCLDEKSQCSQKLRFRHYYQWLLLQIVLHNTPIFTGAWGEHKHQEYNYSHHRTQNSYQLFRKPSFDTNVGFLLFLHVTPSNLLDIIAKDITFSVSGPVDVTKLQKTVLSSHRLADFRSQCQWTRIFVSFTIPMAMGTQLSFKRHRESHSSSWKL